jgi:hypothetical protein
MGGPADCYLDAVRQAMPQWFTWGVLSPVIIQIDRWIAPGRSLITAVVSASAVKLSGHRRIAIC